MPVKIYPTGTVVLTPNEAQKRKANKTSFNNETGAKAKRNQVYSWHFKARQKVRAAVLHNHFIAGESSDHIHAFLTCTLRAALSAPDSCGLIDNGSNKPMDRFTRNLVKSYGCVSYTWVRELTKRGTPHWHMSCVIPRTDIKTLNKAWVSARGGDYHPFALRTGYDKRAKRFRMQINTYQAAMNYIAPYMAKTTGKSQHRLYSVGGPCKPPGPTTYDPWNLLGKAMQDDPDPYQGEYATIYRLKNPNLAYLLCQKMA